MVKPPRVDAPAAQGRGSGMGFVEPFSHAMIETFLEADGLHYLRDQDGDFIVQFGYDEEIDGHPRFLLAVAGDESEQFCLRGDTLRRVPRPDWDHTLRLCNEWNAHYKMPKVYFEVDDPNASSTGRVVCEQWLDLEVGAQQDQINHFASTFFSACFGFWRWLGRQDALSALADDPEDDPTGAEPDDPEPCDDPWADE